MNDRKPASALLWLVAIGVFMQMLDSTIVNTALPSMAHSLGETPVQMRAIVIAYALTMATLIPASGWLADRFGTRRVFFVAMLVFTIGSLCCAYSQSLDQLVASRVLQGIGGAMLLPVGRLAVLRSFPGPAFLPAMSFVAVPGLIGPLIGPTLGGWLVEVASWHWVFLINIPVGVIGCLATLKLMPSEPLERVGRFDLGGYLLLSISMVAISLALDAVSDIGVRGASVLVLLVFGSGCFVAYWLHAMRRPNPLFPTALFTLQTYRIGVLGNLFSRIGSGAMPFLIPLALQVGIGFSPLEAGLLMVPVTVAGIASKSLVTPLVVRLGYRRTLVGNTILVGLMIASFGLISPDQPMGLRITQMAAFGLVNSLQFTVMNAVTLKDLTGAFASSGNSLLSMVMMLSMSFGVAAAGALFGAFSHVFAARPDHALAAFHATFVCIGLITSVSTWIFWQLTPGIGRETEVVQPGIE